MKLDYGHLNNLFNVVMSCSQHGTFSRIRDAAMKELREIDDSLADPPAKKPTPVVEPKAEKPEEVKAGDKTFTINPRRV